MNSQSAANDLSNFKLYGSSSTISLNDVLIKLDKFDWETGDNIYYIYVLTEPNTLNIRYVGITKTPLIRFKDHIRNHTKNETNHKFYWIKSLKKQNILPDMYILDIVKNTEEIADIIETYYIQELAQYFKLTNYYKHKKEGGVYNNKYKSNKSKPVFVFDKKGDLFEKFNTVFEFIDKYKTSRSYVTGATRKKALFQGKYFLSRTEFIDKSLLVGKGTNAFRITPCYEFDNCNNIINIFDSMKQASLSYGFSKNVVNNSIKNNRKCNDKIFSLDKNFKINTLLEKAEYVPIIKSKKVINVYDLNNNLINTFDTIKACRETLNIPIFDLKRLKNGIYMKYKLKIIEDMI